VPETRLDVEVAVEGRSNLSGLFGRDTAATRELERAVIALRQQAAQGVARGGVPLAAALPGPAGGAGALATVGRAQDQLAAAQRQAVQVAARAALPPGLPRAGPGASLVPRPSPGAGVFGAGAGGTAAAAMARQQASNLARQNEWQRGQDRLAALAGAGRGPTSQGPQAAREMADAAERLNRTLRDSAGLTRRATDAERDRGKAVGGAAQAAAAGASAALGAGLAVAAAGGKGQPRTELREAARAAVRGFEGEFTLPQLGGKQAIRLPRTVDPAVMAASLDAQEIRARTAAEVAKRQAAFVGAPGGVAAVRDVAAAQALQRQREAEARLAVAKVPKGDVVIDREQRAYRAEVESGEVGRLKLTESARREAAIRAERLQFTPTGTPRAGATAALRQQGAEFELAGKEAEEWAAQALALRTGTGRSAADRARSAALGIGGTEDRAAAARAARADVLGGTNAQQQATVSAQARAAFAGSREGVAELRQTALYRREEARALRSIDWQRAVSEQGRFGATLDKVSEKSKGVGNALGALTAFRIAEIGALAAAASPSSFATLTDSATLAAVAAGKPFVGFMDDASRALQSLAKSINEADPVTKKWGSDVVIWTTALAGAGYLAAKGLQAASSVWKGLGSAGEWLRGLGVFGRVNPANAYLGNMGPGGAAAAGGAGNGTLFGQPLGGAVGGLLGGLAAATAGLMLFKYSLEDVTAKNRAAVDRAISEEDRLRRADVEKSDTFKKLTSEPDVAKRKKLADEEYDAALRRWQEAAKRQQETNTGIAGLGSNYSPLGELFKAAGMVGKSRGEKAREELDAASKQYAIAKAAREEFVEGRKFQGGAKSTDTEQRDNMLRSLVGLPQPKIGTAEDVADRLTLAALNPEGDLRAEIEKQQLESLKGIGGLLGDIKLSLEKVPQPYRRR
jgi:hypothetical protein